MKTKILHSNICLAFALASTLGTRPCDATSMNSETKSEQPITLIVVGEKEPAPSLPEDFKPMAIHLFAREEEVFIKPPFSNRRRGDSFGRPPKQIGSRTRGFNKPFSRRR